MLTIEKLEMYKKNGLVSKARHLLENLDNVLLRLDHEVSIRFENISSLLKLNLYEDKIREASADMKISEVISVARFLLENEKYLGEIVHSKQEEIIIVSSDSEEELPDIYPSKKPVKGIRGFHRFRPYRHKATSTVTSRQLNLDENKSVGTPVTQNQNITEIEWRKRQQELLESHASELQRVRDEIKTDLLRCMICLSEEKESTFVPCGHTVCQHCAAKIKATKHCCFCRCEIKGVVKVRLTD